MKLGICGNTALEDLADIFDKIYPDSDIITGFAESFEKELSSPFGEFCNLDFCILSIDWEQLFPALFQYACGDDPESMKKGFSSQVYFIKELILKFRNVSNAKILIFTPLSGIFSPTGFVDRLVPCSYRNLYNECQSIFDSMCQSLPDVYPVDLELLSSQIGKLNTFDNDKKYLFNCPYSPVMLSAIVSHIQDMIMQLTHYPIKCIVLDLDNTMWGGIVGETGPEQIILSDRGCGRAFKDFQAQIVRLYKQGIMLAICSKNNTCDALEAMETHPHMLIRPSMISSFRINWDSKPQNLIQIAEELNCSLASLLFIDDSPSERELVRNTLPQIQILDLPADPAYYVDCIAKNHRYWPIQITKDDMKKNRFTRDEKMRHKDAKLEKNIETFLQNSLITAAISEAAEQDFSRIVQLFNKTNQFNLTTRRYNLSALQKLLTVKENHLFYMDMKDKYGDYGTIATALVCNDTIDSFILSCRVFGKKAEICLGSFILNFLKSQGLKQVKAEFIPSGKNGMTEMFYSSLGFTLARNSEKSRLWIFDLSHDILKGPEWITVSR